MPNVQLTQRDLRELFFLEYAIYVPVNYLVKNSKHGADLERALTCAATTSQEKLGTIEDVWEYYQQLKLKKNIVSDLSQMPFSIRKTISSVLDKDEFDTLTQNHIPVLSGKYSSYFTPFAGDGRSIYVGDLNIKGVGRTLLCELNDFTHSTGSIGIEEGFLEYINHKILEKIGIPTVKCFGVIEDLKNKNILLLREWKSIRLTQLGLGQSSTRKVLEQYIGQQGTTAGELCQLILAPIFLLLERGIQFENFGADNLDLNGNLLDLDCFFIPDKEDFFFFYLETSEKFKIEKEADLELFMNLNSCKRFSTSLTQAIETIVKTEYLFSFYFEEFHPKQLGAICRSLNLDLALTNIIEKNFLIKMGTLDVDEHSFGNDLLKYLSSLEYKILHVERDATPGGDSFYKVLLSRIDNDELEQRKYKGVKTIASIFDAGKNNPNEIQQLVDLLMTRLLNSQTES